MELENIPKNTTTKNYIKQKCFVKTKTINKIMMSMNVNEHSPFNLFY